MSDSFTVRAAEARSESRPSESEALALAFAEIRAGHEPVTLLRPDGTEVGHEALLTMMAGE